MAEEQPVLEKDPIVLGPRNSWMNILMVVVLVLAAGVGGYFAQELITGNSNPETSTPAMRTQPTISAQPVSPAVGVMVPLEPFVVNLARSKGNRILKVTVTMELNSPAVQPEVEDNRQKILDSILVLLSSKSFEDVYSIQGKFKLKDEIATRVNRFLAMGHVKDVYFSEFLIQ